MKTEEIRPSTMKSCGTKNVILMQRITGIVSRYKSNCYVNNAQIYLYFDKLAGTIVYNFYAI